MINYEFIHQFSLDKSEQKFSTSCCVGLFYFMIDEKELKAAENLFWFLIIIKSFTLPNNLDLYSTMIFSEINNITYIFPGGNTRLDSLTDSFFMFKHVFKTFRNILKFVLWNALDASSCKENDF